MIRMQNKDPLLAFVLGAIGGGLVVAVATKAIPKMMSEVMPRMMHNIMSEMGEAG